MARTKTAKKHPGMKAAEYARRYAKNSPIYGLTGPQARATTFVWPLFCEDAERELARRGY